MSRGLGDVYKRQVFSPFQNGFSYIVNKVTDTTDFIREMNGYKEENARLVGEINELKKQNKDVANYREENERLKETLELQNSLEIIQPLPRLLLRIHQITGTTQYR